MTTTCTIKQEWAATNTCTYSSTLDTSAVPSGMVPIGCIQGQVRYLHVTQAHCDRIHEPWRDIFVAGRPILFSHDPYLAGWLPCLASRSQFF